MKLMYGVRYVTGYCGCGVNDYKREYGFGMKEAANVRAEELKAAGWTGVEVFFY